MTRITRLALSCVCVAAAVIVAPAVAQADVIKDWNAIAQPRRSCSGRPPRPTRGSRWSRARSTTRSTRSTAAIAVPRRPRRRRGPAVGVAGCGRRDGGSPRAKAITPVAAMPGSTRPTPPRWRIPDGPTSREASLQARPRRPRCSPRGWATGSCAFVPTIGPDPGDWRPSAAGHSGVRPRRLGREHEAVPDQEPFAVPLGGPVPAHQRIRRGLQRGEGARRAEQLDPYGRPDGGRDLLAVRTARSGTCSCGISPIGTTSTRPTRPASRDGQPRGGRRCDRLLERQVLLEVLAAEGGDPRGRDRRQPGTIADPTWESLFDPATPTTPPLGTPPFPDHPSGHGCMTGAVMNTHSRLLRHRQGRLHWSRVVP